MPISQNKIWAVVPAAGVGARMAADVPKQYLPLADKTILETTLDRLLACPSVSALVLGINPEDTYWPDLAYSHAKLSHVTAGGSERAHTVLNALQHIIEQGGSNDWALVHDAVRPCVRIDDIENLIASICQAGSVLASTSIQGGLLAVPVSDTMKRANAEGLVLETVLRDGLWRAMTPQLFKVAELAKALKASIKSGFEATDESAAMERMGHQPLLVACQADNIKITTPDDLALAAEIIKMTL